VTTLNDKDIALGMEKGKLIRHGDPTQLSGACYELRLGNVYYDLSEGDNPIQIPAGGMALLKPGHRVVLITQEELDIPNDMLATIFSKGSLFSIGLSPAATYADPGFSGHLGIVTQNISNKYIVLPTLEPIAKIEFTRLSGKAQKPYKGQHGFQSQIWPIKHHLQKTYAEVAGHQRLGTEKEESYRLLPQTTVETIKRLERRRLWIDGAIFLAVMLNAVALFLVQNKLVDNFQGLIGNLVASAIVGLLALYANRK
jgi:dCTP deaminase